MSFWDSSALVPLCVNEPRSQSTRRFWRRFRERFVWAECPVEIQSSLARLKREGQLTMPLLRFAAKQLAMIELNWIIVPSSLRLTQLARTFPETYGLRALDSLQLAAALVWCKENPKNNDFVCGDGRLLKAAESAGFTIHDLS